MQKLIFFFFFFHLRKAYGYNAFQIMKGVCNSLPIKLFKKILNLTLKMYFLFYFNRASHFPKLPNIKPSKYFFTLTKYYYYFY
jgi:hypothetical protein